MKRRVLVPRVLGSLALVGSPTAALAVTANDVILWGFSAIGIAIGFLGAGIGAVFVGGLMSTVELTTDILCETLGCEDTVVMSGPSDLETADTNPDPSYSSLASSPPLSVTLPPPEPGTPASIVTHGAEITGAVSVVLPASRDLVVTVERYYGALAAGDPSCAAAFGGQGLAPMTCSEIQLAHASGLITTINAGFDAIGAALVGLSQEPLTQSYSITAAEVAAYVSDVDQNGFSSEEQAILVQLDPTAGELAAIADRYFPLVAGDLPFSSKLASVALAEGGQAFLDWDVREQLPSSFPLAIPPVETMPPLGTAILASVILSLGVIGVGVLVRSRATT